MHHLLEFLVAEPRLNGFIEHSGLPGGRTHRDSAFAAAIRMEDGQLTEELSDERTARPESRAQTDGLTKGQLVVQVLLVDDHAMVRQGLRSVLESYDDIQVIGEAQNGTEAVSLVQELRPQVVVMDINMPKMNGFEATARIKTQWPQTIVVGISVNAEEDNRMAMMRAGAARLLTKEQAVEQLHDAILQEVRRTDLPSHR